MIINSRLARLSLWLPFMVHFFVHSALGQSEDLSPQENNGESNAIVNLLSFDTDWFAQWNPWSHERRLSRQWEAGIETPDQLDLKTLMLDEAHSFLLFDPVPERVALQSGANWVTFGGIRGTTNFDIDSSIGQAQRTRDTTGIDVRRTKQGVTGPETFWTSASTYEFRLLTDVSREDEWEINYLAVHYQQGKKWTAPLPWGGTSIGLELGTYIRAERIDQSTLTPSLKVSGDEGTTAGELGGFGGVDLYQQLIHNHLSLYTNARLHFGGLIADELLNDSNSRSTTTLGAGLEWRPSLDYRLTSRIGFEWRHNVDNDRVIVADSHHYIFSLNF